MKFIVSGSSSVNVLTGGAEALVGLMLLQIVFPMKFLETIRFHMEKKDFERKLDRVN